MILKQIPQCLKYSGSNNYQTVLRFASSKIGQVHRNQFCSQLPSGRNQELNSIQSSEKIRQIRCFSINVDSTSYVNGTISENVSSKYKELTDNFKWRTNPVITTLDTPQFQSILQRDILNLAALFEKNGYELRIAGGAVRDLLLNVVPADFDFATTATPKQMFEMFTKANIRTINTNGERFGTVTPRINDKVTYQVTTLRIDLHTDGRHAKVEFTTDWLLDAHRRDFTINSMYLGFDGKVYDYFFGYEDLKSRRVRFLGEPDKRIKEDYLRILRYFRFYGKVSDSPNNFDAKTIKVICENIDGLQKISGPRIWIELKKILYGKYRFDIFAKLIECGASKYISLPASVDCNDLLRLKKTLETSFKDLPINPITILSTLLNSEDDAIHLNSKLKFTAFDRDLAVFLVENKAVTPDIDKLLYYQKMCVPQKNFTFKVLKEFVLELLKYNDKRQIYDQLLNWDMPKLPVTESILEQHRLRGRKANLIIDKLHLIWADSNFQISREELLQQHLITVAAKVTEELSHSKKVKTQNVIARQ